MILFSTVWMGLIGFLDDYLKIVKKYKRGLIARYKMAGQIILGCLISYWIYQLPEYLIINSKTTVPFLKNAEIDLGVLYPLMVIIVITGTSNAVNLTDGLDGLAAGLLAICFTVFSAIAYITGRVDFSNYLNILYLPGAGELAVFSSAMAGACIDTYGTIRILPKFSWAIQVLYLQEFLRHFSSFIKERTIAFYYWWSFRLGSFICNYSIIIFKLTKALPVRGNVF